MNVLIGADPELFLQHEGKFISGFDMIPGTKAEPYPVKNGAVQVDGMALEFNITPAKNVQQFSNNIETVMQQLRSMVDTKYDIVISPTADFDKTYMENQPPEAKLLGCDPDYCAYTGERNPEPQAHPTMRTAAGHVHVGWTRNQEPLSPAHFSSCMQLAIQLDYALSLPAMFKDPDKRRREMYGQPGAFRPKPYGVEYRSLSNYWLNDRNEIINVYQNTMRAITDLFRGQDYQEHIAKKYRISAKEIIDTGDLRSAERICNYLGLGRTR